MAEYRLNTAELRSAAPSLRAGDRVYLSGTIYTARDQAHLALFRLLDAGEELPLEIKDAVIYYAGPTPGRGDMPTLSCGPTTSGRMDGFTPRLLELGLAAMIGKGPRSQAVKDSIVKNGAVYLCATGGAGALIAKSIVSLKEIAFLDLGCESLKRLEVRDLPLIVGIDCRGGDIFLEGAKYAQ
ncbi:MAG: fumarate hydratase C-terminal domain-containing protein [Oscillospiraceae bacterium]|nr:fumarate hydratase C-terminal domain-containing protein [Oscillospiraceae bacterium]